MLQNILIRGCLSFSIKYELIHSANDLSSEKKSQQYSVDFNMRMDDAVCLDSQIVMSDYIIVN